MKRVGISLLLILMHIDVQAQELNSYLLPGVINKHPEVCANMLEDNVFIDKCNQEIKRQNDELKNNNICFLEPDQQVFYAITTQNCNIHFSTINNSTSVKLMKDNEGDLLPEDNLKKVIQLFENFKKSQLETERLSAALFDKMKSFPLTKNCKEYAMNYKQCQVDYQNLKLREEYRVAYLIKQRDKAIFWKTLDDITRNKNYNLFEFRQAIEWSLLNMRDVRLHIAFNLEHLDENYLKLSASDNDLKYYNLTYRKNLIKQK